MLRRPGRRAAALGVLLALALALPGCGLIEPPPPDNVVGSVNRAVDAIRATDGVAEVSARISPRDSVAVPKNELWTASIEVRAEADASGFGPLAEAVERHVVSARDTVLATATVSLPADDAGALVAIAIPSGAAGDIADAAVSLRHIEHATRVSATSGDTQITLTIDSPDAIEAAVAELRTLPEFGQGALAAVTVTAQAPSGRPSTVRVTAPSDPSGTSPHSSAPESAVPSAPNTDAEQGDYPEVMSLGPEAAAVQLQSDLDRVTALLDAAGDTAGIRGVAHVAVTTCDRGVGQHVRGYVLLPIFEIMDSPVAPFDAIALSWNRQGFVATDRALGTDLFSQQDDSDSVRGLTIRGTSEGLSISAESVCVVSG